MPRASGQRGVQSRACKAIYTGHLGGCKADYIGELWLRDVESAAWEVLHAYRGRRTWEDQQELVRAWQHA